MTAGGSSNPTQTKTGGLNSFHLTRRFPTLQVGVCVIPT